MQVIAFYFHIEKQLNEDFANICDWFIDNKLSIHFSEDKTKTILFASKGKIKKLQKLKIISNNIQIKQHSRVTSWVVYLKKQCLGNQWLIK